MDMSELKAKMKFKVLLAHAAGMVIHPFGSGRFDVNRSTYVYDASGVNICLLVSQLVEVDMSDSNGYVKSVADLYGITWEEVKAIECGFMDSAPEISSYYDLYPKFWDIGVEIRKELISDGIMKFKRN